MRQPTRTGVTSLRWWGLGELVVILVSLLLAGLVVLVTDNSLTTFRRDIPLSSVTQEVQLDLLRAQIGTFEVLGDDERASAEVDVLAPLGHASRDCLALLSGGAYRAGRLEPLTDPARRQQARSLCEDIETYRGLTVRLFADPEANGEGTPFDTQIDTLFAQMIDETELLSQSLDESIRSDANNLRLVGDGAAGLVLALGAVITVLWSRHRRLRAAQTQQLARFAAIIRSSGDAISSVSPEGLIRSWNPGAEALYGYSAAEAVGADGSMLVPPGGEQDYADVWLPVARGEATMNLETDGVRKDGSVVPLAMTLSPIVEEDTVVGVSVVARDITERRAKDLQLATARNDALEASRMKSQFLSTMSHEIRTPLNGVLGLNELMLQTPLSEIQHQYARGIDVAGAALLAVINDILDFSKLEAGKVDLDIVAFDPRELVDEIAALLAAPAHTKGLELLAFCSPEVPTTLAGDAGRIRQILLNLAANAVKFTAVGEVLIRVALTTSPDEGDRVRFEVRDTGIGLAEEGRQSLFESFSQADASTTRRFGGTGLGLAISQRLVTAMKGSIGVESELGQGSEFWFSLPLLEAATVPARPSGAARPLLPGLRVLVVDDNATNRLILTTQLTAWRMEPDAVSDADSALSHLSAAARSNHPYDIAVLDLLMPDVDGLELARRMSADPALAHTRKIMLTSTGHVDGDELAGAGIEQWCTKPVRTSALYDRLMRLMTPVRPAASPVTAAVAPSTAKASRGRILVAEDNEINQLVAEGIVTILGFEVDIVGDGAQALAALAGQDYAAVLMDCHMPVMDGFEATRRIRSDAAPGSHIPIIAMTAAALTEDRDRCLAAGMDGYVSKPVTIEGLEEVLSHWVTEPAALS